MSHGHRRMPLPAGLLCHYCDAAAVTKDHRVPQARCVTADVFAELGHGSVAEYHRLRRVNLAPSCVACNNAKADGRSRCACADCLECWAKLPTPGWTPTWWDGPGTFVQPPRSRKRLNPQRRRAARARAAAARLTHTLGEHFDLPEAVDE